MTFTKSTEFINQQVTVTIDRPIGSLHPEFCFEYPINYGYIPNTISPDGKELDAYILGIQKPLKTFHGKCIAVIKRLNDNDDKLIVVPQGILPDNQKIKELTNFQEQFFQIEIIRKAD